MLRSWLSSGLQEEPFEDHGPKTAKLFGSRTRECGFGTVSSAEDLNWEGRNKYWYTLKGTSHTAGVQQAHQPRDLPRHQRADSCREFKSHGS
ncbi:hypothetical protein QR680_012804 [Steinernema hermaphroditum]|uniref:Uncharacterized protein n=1 Tax=Steinernema hermaphroditum TaxID=289476 RepID=A0AA39M0G8_9BILA|nr:hypothetical protein QR680_012804 [Steinernema hermaphroditum]